MADDKQTQAQTAQMIWDFSKVVIEVLEAVAKHLPAHRRSERDAFRQIIRLIERRMRAVTRKWGAR